MIEWFNANSGFVSILIFAITLIFGWVSGIFQALRKRPKFKIKVIPGPTMCSTFHTGNKIDGYDAHRTAISLYLKISNIGNSASDIDRVEIGYHWNLSKKNWLWVKYGLGWFWLKNATVAIEDFRSEIDKDNMKFFPFLFQRSFMTNQNSDLYLKVGKNTTGIIYFEQGESWGASSPIVQNGHVKIKIKVYDVFSKAYTTIATIPMVELSEAKKYTQYFGETLEAIENNREKKEK